MYARYVQYQGYSRMPLHESAPYLSTIVTTDGLYRPTRMRQVVLSVTAYFQATVREVLTRLLRRTCSVCVDDIVIWVKGVEKLIRRLEGIFARLVGSGLLVAAHVEIFFGMRSSGVDHYSL